MHNPNDSDNLIDEHTAIFWFRRDLRLPDNAGLYHALKECKNVLPVFIFDTTILDELEDRADKRVLFIHETLAELKAALEKLGSTLCILHGDPVNIFKKLKPGMVYANGDYEPYARRRDAEVDAILSTKGSGLKLYKDHVVFEKAEVIKDNGEPYTIFTPYSSKWKSSLNAFFLKPYPTEKYFKNLKQSKPLKLPGLDEVGFLPIVAEFPKRVIRQSIIENYDQQRNFPGIRGTTRLGIHLRFGSVSIRTLAKIALEKNQVWLKELIWRDFYQMILWHFPHVQTHAFKAGYDHIPWRNDPAEFAAWCDGKTGYPIVDAGMRELNSTGFMHNRVRMITASFLTKHLLVDWRLGEAYFAKKLLDYDLAANNGGWQWAAGSGCDAAPYFRIFNPQLQAEKFDPNSTYVKMWVPEVGTREYPQPIVDHTFARERVLKVFKKTLEGA